MVDDVSVPSSSGCSLRLPRSFYPAARPGAVSVPSSSGCSLRRLRVRQSLLVKCLFQSPLHRGALCGLEDWPIVGRARSLSFSPLFIGVLSAALTMAIAYDLQAIVSVPSSSGCSLRPLSPSTASRGCRTFQSPLHRGALCGSPGRAGRRQARCVSVPSSSGCSLRLNSLGLERRLGASVSVPSSSGCSLRRRQRFGGERLLQVSVPSSSGCSLRQQRSRCAREPGHTGFSPLFIGVLSAALAGIYDGEGTVFTFQSPLHRGALCGARGAARSTASSSMFQSPLHRGALCGTSSTRARGAARSSFSPLFIGVLSAAYTVPDRGTSGYCCFSPLFIGVLSAASHGVAQPTLGPSVSVPSSSGCSLRQPLLAWRVDQEWWFQSPLHRGALCGAATSGSCRSASRGFSPLFIGVLSAALATKRPTA